MKPAPPVTRKFMGATLIPQCGLAKLNGAEPKAGVPTTSGSTTAEPFATAHG
jgi:hypothetical protein